ncbi:MAG: lysylphosphatidylglycerol synthase transmembrane domain-containing protein [Candidatus Saccharimonas sp.]
MKKISIRTWLSVVTFALIGIILFFSRKEIIHAWQLVGSIQWWILLLIIPIILLGYLAAGEMIFSYLRQKKLIKHVSIWTQMRISLELNFVNHILPSGGLSGMSYMNWRLGKLGVTAGKATMAQAVRYVAGFGAMAVLLAAAVLFVTIDGTVNRWIILMSSALVTMMIVVTLSCVFLMSSITRMQKFARIVSRLVNGIVKRVTFGRVKSVLTATRVQEFLEDMHDDYAGLMREKRMLWQPFLWGVFFTLTEIAIFWVVFWALGSPVNPAPILIGYGLASIAGFIIVTPGGAGAYEAVMILTLGIAGMSHGEAIAGIILARVLILLVTILAGYVLYQQVVMKYGKRPDADI